MSESFILPANKDYKRAYKARALPVSPIYQSKEVEMKDKRFVLVGQYLLHRSPLVSHFDVVDCKFQSVDDEIAKQVHDIIIKMQLVYCLQPLLGPIEAQNEIQQNIQHGIDEMLIGQADLANITFALHELVDQTATLRMQSVINGPVLEQFLRKWDVFWTLYEERSLVLRRMLPQLVKRINKFQDATEREQQLFTAILDEGHMLQDIFSYLASGQETLFETIDHFLEWSYKLGRIDSVTKPAVSLSLYEKATYKMLKALLIFSYWIVIPFTLLMFVIEGFLFSILVFPATVLVVYRPVYKQFIKRIQLKKAAKLEVSNKERLAELQRDTNTLLTHKGQTGQTEQTEQTESKELYSVKGAYTNISLAVLYFGVVILGVLMVLRYMYDFNINTIVLVSVGTVTVVISFSLPYMKISYKTLTLLEDGLLLGKFKVYSNLINEITWNKESGSVKIKHADNDVDTSLIIDKKDRQQTEEALKAWVELTNIPFRELKKGKSPTS